MFAKCLMGTAAVMILAAAVATPAECAGSKPRAIRSAPSQIPPPAYGFRGDGRAHSSNPAFDVYVNGKYAGSDPDPRVRANLARDPWGGRGGT